jgi:hypothetical protein
MLRARNLASAALTASLITMGGVGATVLSAGAAQAAACPTASQIVTDINAVTSVAGDLNAQLGTLGRNSGSGDVQSVAQSTTSGLAAISNDLNQDASALNGCSALGSADSAGVANAFDGLAAATNQMLSTLTRDQPVFAQFGQTAPITSALRSLEGTFDSYAYALVSVAPSQQGAIASDQSSVETSLGDEITLYSQICIPSPLYPTLQPLCIAV